MSLRDAMNAIQAWAAAESALTAIWRPPPKGEEPPRPYLTLESVVTSKVGGTPYRTAPDASGESVVLREIEFTVSITYLGDTENPDPREPGLALEELAGSLELGSVLESLAASDVAIREVNPVNAIPALTGARYEPRATLDVRLAVALEYSDNPGFVERVIGSGDVNDNTFNFDVEV